MASSPLPRPPTNPEPRVALILRQMSRVFELGDRDSLDTVSDFLALRIDLLEAAAVAAALADAVH